MMNHISVRVVILFTIAILVSFIPEQFPKFFGDYICDGVAVNHVTGLKEKFLHKGYYHTNIELHFGYRHWLFLIMGIVLFVIQSIKIIELIPNKDGNKR